MGLHEKIVELLPEIDDIEDNTLRERVIATWIAATRRGGWNESDLESIPIALSAEGQLPCDLVTYTRAVTRTGMAIAKALDESFGEGIEVDSQLVIAASLLHAVGRLLGWEHDEQGKIVQSRGGKLLRYPVSGVVLAGELGVPDEILHIIAGHAEEGDLVPRTLEGLIVHHAERVNFERFHT